MFATEDLGKDVKVMELSGIRTRGYVKRVGADEVELQAEQGDVVIPFSNISTVTRVGDFSS